MTGRAGRPTSSLSVPALVRCPLAPRLLWGLALPQSRVDTGFGRDRATAE